MRVRATCEGEGGTLGEAAPSLELPTGTVAFGAVGRFEAASIVAGEGEGEG